MNCLRGSWENRSLNRWPLANVKKSWINLLLFPLSLIINQGTGNRLNEYILHYETLDYDAEAVATQHSRSKRNADVGEEESYVHVNFRSHGKPFRLKLKRDTSTFSPDVQFVSHQGHPLDVDTSHLYEGRLQGELTPRTLVLFLLHPPIYINIHARYGRNRISHRLWSTRSSCSRSQPE